MRRPVFDPETYVVPDDALPAGATKRQFENGAKVSAWFLFGVDRRSIVTIGEIAGATWTTAGWMYELVGCPNIFGNAYIATERELTPTEPEDYEDLKEMAAKESAKEIVPE